MIEIDKFELARETFVRLKEESKHTGKSISISRVAKESGVDRKYFYGEINTPSKELKERWRHLGDSIRSYKKEQSDNPALKSKEHREALKALEFKYTNSVQENYSLLEQLETEKKKVDRLLKQRDAATSQVDDLKSRVSALEIAAPRSQKVDSGKIVQFPTNPTIVSPDLNFEKELERKKAWNAALNELRQALSDGADKDLLITIGIPGSGKSTWAKNFRSKSGRKPIVFDATSLTQVDRFDVLEIARSSSNTELIAVCFTTDLDIALKRNAARTGDDKVPEAKVKEMHSRLQYPVIDDKEEMFSEIIVINGAG